MYDFRLCLQFFENMKKVDSIFRRQAQRCCGCPPFFRSNPRQRVAFSMLLPQEATGRNRASLPASPVCRPSARIRSPLWVELRLALHSQQINYLILIIFLCKTPFSQPVAPPVRGLARGSADKAVPRPWHRPKKHLANQLLIYTEGSIPCQAVRF